MSDKPILFNGPMVRAILKGRKTQTRRVVSKQAALDAIAIFGPRFLLVPGNVDLAHFAVGDRLWVRESAAVRYQSWNHETGHRHAVSYRADEDENGCLIAVAHPGSGIRNGKAPSVFPSMSHNANGRCRWSPSIHMPRWASRLTLIVTDVRVQRLQDISEEDATEEGVECDSAGWFDYQMPSTQCCQNARDGFRTLWDSLAKPGATWDENPWVAAYTFTAHRCNIDALAKDAPKAKGRPESLPNGARFSCSMPMPEADVRNVGDGYAGASIAHAETDDNAGSAAE